MKERIFLSREAINSALKFASKACIRYGLVGLWVDASDPVKPVITSTDGHRLHKIQVDNSHISQLDSDSVIQGAIDKNLESVTLSPGEVIGLTFKVKEIQTIAKLHGRKNSEFANMRIKFASKRIVLKAHDNVLVRAVTTIDRIPEKLVGEVIGINIAYLLESLEVFEGKDIKIMIHDNVSPIIVKPTEGDSPLHVLMPVRVHGRIS